MHDPVRYALWVGAISLFAALGCALYIVWMNGASRNLALALGALVGTCVVFLLQLLFELQSTTTTTDFPVEFTTDYSTRAVRNPKAYRQNPYASYRNIFTEANASTFLATLTPAPTKDDAPKITRDLAIISIIAFLIDEQFDWKLNAVSYRTSMGQISTSEPLSKPSECTAISGETIHLKLKTAGNLFSDMPRFGMRDSFCLPPNSTVEITASAITFRNLACEIAITLREPFSSMTTIDPHAVADAPQKGYIDAQSPTLPDGAPQYITVVVGARATVTFFALRAQSRDLIEYQNWTNRIVNGVKSRFETTP
jgi:hypothetical protein